MAHMKLECTVCKQRNVFSLGFVPVAPSGRKVCVCREPCRYNSSEIGEPDMWESLVEFKSLSPRLVKQPEREEMSGQPKFFKGKQTRESSDLPSVKPQFQDPTDYAKVFRALLVAEQTEELKSNSVAHVYQGIPVTFRTTHDVSFPFEISKKTRRLKIGDEFYLSRHEYPREGSRWGARCSITYVGLEVEAQILSATITQGAFGPHCERKPGIGAFSLSKHLGFSLQFVADDDYNVSYDRMFAALDRFEEGTAVNEEIKNILLGVQVPSEPASALESDQMFRNPNLAPTNPTQSSAISTALQSRLCCIQGPPGTGKFNASHEFHFFRKDRDFG